MFPAGPHKKQPAGTGGRQEISFICEGQYNQSIQDLPLSWRRSVKSCQSPPERAGVFFPQNLIGLSQMKRGRGLIPLGASHVARGAAPRRGHSPAPQCTARRVTRSGGSRLDRYDPAPHSPPSSLLGVARTPDLPLPSLSRSPATVLTLAVGTTDLPTPGGN